MRQPPEENGDEAWFFVAAQDLDEALPIVRRILVEKGAPRGTTVQMENADGPTILKIE